MRWQTTLICGSEHFMENAKQTPENDISAGVLLA
jgi:hypothetical protein